MYVYTLLKEFYFVCAMYTVILAHNNKIISGVVGISGLHACIVAILIV